MIQICGLSIVVNAKILLVYQVERHGARSGKVGFDGLIEDEDQNFVVNGFSLTKLGL